MDSLDGVIYMYTSPSGKMYIGKTTNEYHRKVTHRNQAKNPKDYFHRAMAKYGFDSFTYEVLFRTKSYDTNKLNYILNTMEQYYIKKYGTTDPSIGYNLTIGGEGTKGFKHSEETKALMSLHSPKVREWAKGKERTQDTKKKIAEKMLGGKKICQYTLDMEFVASYDSYVEAAEAVGLNSKSSIYNCVTGRSKTSKNFIWKLV